MELFKKKIGPVFLKATSDATSVIEQLEALLPQATGDVREEIEKQIKVTTYGEVGENNVAFELKNSGMDMYILRDIYLEHGELSAQIDYLVITRKHVYIIECKNLIGNIEIDNMGNFIRSYDYGNRKIKEGFYSPITQNERHLLVIKNLRGERHANFIAKSRFENSFPNIYKSIVVLANPKTILNAKYAKKEVKQKVIRLDQLIAHIKAVDGAEKDYSFKTDDMLATAQFFLDANKEKKTDYIKKYAKEIPQKTEDNSFSTNKEELIKKLKDFRWCQSKLENIKPYYIFNDMQMNDLIEKNPKNEEELLRVSGFGQVKVEKYGKDILKILSGK
jgi:hypothetical protein